MTRQYIKLFSTQLIPNMNNTISTPACDHGPISRPRTIQQSLLGIVCSPNKSFVVSFLFAASRLVIHDIWSNVPRTQGSVHGVAEDVRSLGIEGEACDGVSMSLHPHRFAHLPNIPRCDCVINPSRVNYLAIVSIGHGSNLIFVLETTHVPSHTGIPQARRAIVAGAHCERCRSLATNIDSIDNPLVSHEALDPFPRVRVVYSQIIIGAGGNDLFGIVGKAHVQNGIFVARKHV
mmetsp:Transcript_18020/g.31032  ORF Transcript_18020/g.31032 Transcript_18020/m.31032 type:complete len:234 (-) Transcript_18020:58-759(-)